MENFTYEELNLIALYDGGTRKKTITALQDMREYLEADEKELMELTDSAIRKLKTLSDASFDELELFPDIEE